MLFIFPTPGLIRHLWKLKTVVFLHWCLICVVLSGVCQMFSDCSQVSQIMFAYFFYTCKHLFLYARKNTFVGGYAIWLHGHISWKGGWGACVGKSSSIHPRSRLLNKSLLSSTADWKNDSSNTNFYILETFIFDQDNLQAWLWFGTNGQMQNLNILAIQPFQI